MNFDITSNTYDNGGADEAQEGGKDKESKLITKPKPKTKVVKPKRLNDLEKETLGMEVDILLHENINF